MPACWDYWRGGISSPPAQNKTDETEERSHAMIDARTLRTDFPILQRRINNKPLLYLDSAATSQRPRPVLQTIQVMNTRYNANIHRAGHSLGLEATELYEQAHENVARFINADSMEEIIFVRNTTEAINLVAYSLALGGAESPQIGAGDEMVLTVMEHHSNLVPWQMVRDQTGAVLRFVGIHADGTLNMDEYRAALTPRTRLVACTHMSNVLGTITPVQEICSLAHQVGALVLIDGAQSAPHLPVDVQALGCDFYAFSGHKMLAPMGVGVLYGRRELLETMRPFLYGGDMIRHVTLDTADWNRLPWKFEAGTANVADGVALGGAVDLRSGQELVGAVGYLHRLGMEQVRKASPLPIIADESCRTESDVDRCAAVFHGINIKLIKCGGLTPARRMIRRARELGLKVMVGCFTESSVCISAAAQLLPLLDHADLDGALLLAEDAADGVRFDHGRPLYPVTPGCGITLKRT